MEMRSDSDFSRPQLSSPISRAWEVGELLECRILPKNCLQVNFRERSDAIVQDSAMDPLYTLSLLSHYPQQFYLVNYVLTRSMMNTSWEEEV